MSELAAFLRQFDDATSHAFESFDDVLHGVTEDEAFFQHAAYAAEEREEGWPPPGSVAWQVAHVAHCKRYYTEILRRAGESDPPEVTPWTPVATFAELRSALASAHAAQRAAMEALGDDRLDVVAGNGMTFREFLSMTIRHDTWHAGQIAVARRLHRTGST